MKKTQRSNWRRIICAALVLALALTLAPGLTLAADVPEQAAAEALSLESIPEQLAQALELDELPPFAELNNADAEQLNSLTINNGDGTSTAYIFQGQIKYLDKETNSVKFIDNKLKESDKRAGFLENYAYENTANDIKVYLPKRIKKGVDIEYENISVNMRPEIVNNEKGVLKEYAFAGENMEVLEYPDAFGEGCHLQYQPLNRGLKENILVEEYNGTNTFSFELKLKKGYAEISGDNRIIYIKDEQDETVFILNQPYARDSFTGIDANLSHRTFNDYYMLEQTGNKTYRVTMVIDEDFLDSAETVYPVLIDPTAAISSGSIQDITALSNVAAQSPLSENITVGYFNGTFYTAYQKNTFIWYYRFMNPSNITNMVHKAYVSSLTNTGFISVYDSNEELTINTDLTYSDILNSEGALKSSTQVTGQGWYEFDITALGREWLKYETRNYGSSAGKSAGHGYIFSFGGPGVIILASADSAANSAYISFNYTEDTSLSNGTYIIRNNFTRRAMQDSGSSVLLNYGSAEQTNLYWIFTKDSDGLYTIKNAGTGRYIYFAGSAVSGSILQAGATQMKWRVIKNTNGSYRFFPVNSIYALEERYFNESDKVYAEGYNGYANQQWELEPEPVVDQVAVRLPNGTYIQKVKFNNSNIKNEAGVALETGDNRQIIIETYLEGNVIRAPFSYTITGTDKISVSRSGSTLTITGLALGEASITITSGSAQTIVPVVVADKVLDVPLIRQEKSQWCWAACAQMLVQYYDPDSTVTQEQMVQFAHNNVLNKDGSTNDIKNIIEGYTDASITIDSADVFGLDDYALRQKLDSGKPVIYLIRRFRINDNKWTGHFRVIYGYYWRESAQEYVYLICDPWDQAASFGSNAHYDIWRRSWGNIWHPDIKYIPDIDRLPASGYKDYFLSYFLY